MSNLEGMKISQVAHANAVGVRTVRKWIKEDAEILQEAIKIAKRRYPSKYGISPSLISKVSGCCRQTVYKYLSGGRVKPGTQTKIENAIEKINTHEDRKNTED